MKEEKIWVKCSEEQKKKIKAQAEEAGATMSDYILSKLLGLELTENKDSQYKQVVSGHEYKVTYNKKRRNSLMKNYIVIRHGSNSANQSMCQEAVVGIIEANNKKEAKEEAYNKWTFYNNQYPEIKTFSEATKLEKEVAMEINAIDSIIIKKEEIGCVVCGKSPDKDLTQKEAEFYACENHR